MSKKYDAIVIGAGNGGMTAATALAQQGMSVLMLERHNVPGGCGTSFRRGRFEFEVALHQLSGMGTVEQPGPLRGLMMRLGIADDIDWIVMDELYRVVVPGEVDMTLKADRAAAIAEVQRHFPEEADKVTAFYDLVYMYMLQAYQFSKARKKGADAADYPIYFKYALKNSDEVLAELGLSKRLSTALTGTYWGYMGLPPSKLPFNLLAGLTFAYIEFKPAHMRGGSQAMSNALINSFLQHGGEMRFNCGAEKILVEDGAVVGVRTAAGEDIACDWVVSNASVVDTYTRLLDEAVVPEEQFKVLAGSNVGVSALCLYIGLDRSPEELGITESLVAISPSLDSDKTYAATRTFDIANCGIVFSTYTREDAAFSPPGTSQCAAVTLQYSEHWEALAPEEYNDTKYRCAAELLKRIDQLYPGFSDHIEEIEIATPITFMRFLNHPGGAFYGFDQFVKDSSIFLPPVSPIKGLYAAGAWVGDCGFQPTLQSGFNAARAIKNKREKEAQA
ncbi:MAG: NAD(P)/FAD-dependent oxidoreductase [Syntrophomonadaceae bacterium]|nr:NAD(P)/FAD-dependent oxidoreductase [Syntrophomonadaceae bacterium]